MHARKFQHAPAAAVSDSDLACRVVERSLPDIDALHRAHRRRFPPLNDWYPRRELRHDTSEAIADSERCGVVVDSTALAVERVFPTWARGHAIERLADVTDVIPGVTGGPDDVTTQQLGVVSL